MKTNKLHLYSIMKLDTDHIDEICEDICMQYKNGISNCVLFPMTLVPEGNPPVDKARMLCEKYALFKEKLSALGVPNGVLVQASIGHGWVLSEMFPYQRYIGYTDGKERNIVCPYDEGFKKYIYNALRTIAEYSPDHIMIDDDLRLMWRDGGGCTCPLHIKRFNELAKTDLTREQLVEFLNSGTEVGNEYGKIFIETQRESLVETAKAMRAGIDSVNPKIPGSFCCCGFNAENAAEISSILAGEGNPSVVRINNGRYTAAGSRFFSDNFFAAAVQIEKLKNKVDVILAETDTCPQNRYSTSASTLHTHFTGSILEGACGAKQWITRLASYEPESGKAYRNILAKYSGFYEALSEIVPSLSWRGCRMPVFDSESLLNIPGNWNDGIESINAWGECVLERFGVPMYFSSENKGVLCLEGNIDGLFTDDKILEALKGPVFLASDSAQNLIKRGFGEYLGVDIREWNGKQPSVEKIYATNQYSGYQMKIKQIVMTNGDTKSLSDVYHTVDKVNYEYLFPGTTMFKNKLGGTVFTFCGTPHTNYNIVEAFSFLNYSRKQQIIEMLELADEIPAYYPGDEEVYLRVADVNDGSLFCGIFNIGLDPIENLELVIKKDVSKIEKLMPDGTKKEISFNACGGRYIIDSACNTLEPVILFVS